MQTIHLDVSNKGVVPTIYAKQGDVRRKFRAVITDNGETYDIPADALLSVWYSGTSGEGNYSMIGENSAFSIDGNTVTVELITQMLTNPGGGNVCLVMNRQDGTQIGTWNIPYIVEQLPGMGSPAAEQYFTALTEAAAKASESAAKAAEAAATFETDTSLSVAGKAADAAATGEALAGKAPAGFGLGVSEPVIIADCNLAVKSGWYKTTDETKNQPLARGCWMRVDAYSDTWTHQVWFNDAKGGGEVHRYQQNGVWTAWEWENPPLDNDVEYRTTRRYGDNVLYTKRINCGSLPTSAATLTTNMGIQANRIVKLEVIAYSSSAMMSLPRVSSNSSNLVDVFMNNANLLIITNSSSYSGYSAVAQIWYYK